MPLTLVKPAPGRTRFYRVRGHEAGVGVNRSTGTTDRRTAQKLLNEWREEARRLAVNGHKPDVPTFASAVASYLKGDRSHRFIDPLLEHFAEKPLTEIDQAAIDAAAVALYPDATPATRNRQVYSPTSAVLRHAGVTIALRRPKGASGNRRLDWLRPEQAFKLLRAARDIHPRFYALLVFLLYTGVRLSEALRLEWKDVDLDHAQALIRITKTGKPVTVHLPRPIINALSGLDRQRPRVFYPIGKGSRAYEMWAEAEKAAGLALPDRTAFHVLRHSHAHWRRLYTDADTSALLATGLWASRDAASRYEHVDVQDESRKSDLLPTEDE
jgi:integrase